MDTTSSSERYPGQPYVFVPFASKVSRESRRGTHRAGHERQDGLTGFLTGQYKAHTPLRVGTGILELGKSGLYQPMFRVNGVDAIVFTGGIGEKDPEMRLRILENGGYLGLKIDPELNARGEINVAAKDSKVAVLVIPTDEELVIAQETGKLVERAALSATAALTS